MSCVAVLVPVLSLGGREAAAARAGKETRQMFTQLHEVRPSDAELRIMLEAGFVLREASKFDDAEAVFRGVIELVPASDVPRVALGTVELQRGRFREAEVICEEALRLAPTSLYARVHRAEAMMFQRRRDEAEAELREIIAADPESPHSRTARALLEAADLICGATEGDSAVASGRGGA